MLALAKFWLPFQKWRIIGKKGRQNGYMLKNLCVFLLTSYDASLQYMLIHVGLQRHLVELLIYIIPLTTQEHSHSIQDK